MSGDSPATVENIWICPFCGRPTWKIQIADLGDESDGVTKYDTGREVKELVLRIECEATKTGHSPFECPAMDESGAYDLHIYPDGTCHAYYY